MDVAHKAGGYRTEIPYLFRYQRELNPAVQALALNCRGVYAGKIQATHRYIELGSGYSLSTLVHAAGNPRAHFVAVDLNPEHISVARRIAKAAQLGNIDLLQCGFAELEDCALGEFDTIAMHGVWSWVSAETRAHLLGFIDKHLAPGGILYVSYNALPGTAAMLPLRELMHMGFASSAGPVEAKISTGLALAEKLQAAGAAYFKLNTRVAETLKHLATRPMGYLAHEYFNKDWWAFYHADVVQTLEPLGLRYGASGHLLDNLDGRNFSQTGLAEIMSASGAVARETLRDFLTNREFRRDVFVREAQPSDTQPHLAATRFVSSGTAAGVDKVVGRTVLGEVRPDKAWAVAVLSGLEAAPASASELARQAACKGMSLDQISDTLVLLAALGAAEPAMDEEGLSQRRAATARLNAVLWQRAQESDAIHANASPVTGGGIAVERLDQLFLLARSAGEDPANTLKRMFGSSIQGDVAANYAVFEAERLPLLVKLGIA